MEKVKRPKPERYVGKFLKQSETVELFEAVKGHKLELGVIFGAFYGLRRSDAYVKHKLKKSEIIFLPHKKAQNPSLLAGTALS
jgi:hypothetical protein